MNSELDKLNQEYSLLRIAVCDDEPAECRHLVQMLEKNLAGHTARLHVFGSADELLSASGHYNLVFLDILMAGKDGMEAARELRTRKDPALIVFVTSSRDYALAGYEVDAFRYIVKPYTEEQLHEVLVQAFGRIEQRGILVTSDDGLHRIPLESIISIEAQGRHCIIRKTDGAELLVTEGISRLEALLPPGHLMRCHRSYIVNVAHIATVKPYDAIMKDGSLVPVRRPLWSTLQERLFAFLGS